MDNDNGSVALTPETPAAAPPPQPAAPETSVRDLLEQQVNPLFSEDGSPKDSIETPQQRATRERGPDGKFARRNTDGSEFPTEKQVKQAEPNLSLDPDVPLDDEPTQQVEDPVPNADNAPKSWKADAKSRWAGVDPVIRAEVHRREREASKAIADHAPVKKFVGEFQQTVQPFAQHYAPMGIQPLELMKNLMTADVTLRTAPAPTRAQFMAKLIKDYQIDINMLDAALSGGDPQQEPMAGVDRLLNERLAPISQFVQSEQQRRQQVVQAEQQRAGEVLRRMEADTQNFPHFALVRQDMADVTELAFKRGVYLTPSEAYKRAVALSPEAQAAEQGRAGQQRAHDAHDAATRSLGASLSVDGSPAGLKQGIPPSDLRGTIEAAWAAAQGR